MMRLTIRILCLLALLPILPATECSAQYFTTGSDPASVKWIQVKTPHFKIICPEDFSRHSQYLANAFEYLYSPVTRTLGSHPRNTPVILHNRTTVANALSAYAPRRIEFYTTPPQDIYAQDWLDQLMIHEFRHSAQYAAVDRGFTRVLSYILGEQAIPAMLGFFVPFWVIEGDATVTETALSHSGRGRVPSFEMKLRAQFLENSIFKYDKAVNGSYRDMIPDRYELGYQLVGKSREWYGEDLWGNVLENVGTQPYTISPVPFSLIRQVGFARRKLYRKVSEGIRKEWSDQDKRLAPLTYTAFTQKPGKNYTSYQLPVQYGDSTVIAERSSIDDLTRIVSIDKNGKEKRVMITPAGYRSESLSGSGKILYWSEQSADPRWEHRNYRIIRALDLESGRIRKITRRTRYFAPAASPGGTMLATVEILPDNSAFLNLLDASTGKILKRISPPAGEFIRTPAWSSDGSSIVVILLGKHGNTLALADTGKGILRILLPWMYAEIKKPVFCKGHILFTASFSGIDNLYALDPVTGKLNRVTNSRFGATDAIFRPGTDELIFADYTSAGYRLVTMKADSSAWIPYPIQEEDPFPLAKTLSQQENFIFDPDSVPKTVYPVKPYRKGLHLFNPHSWAPLYADISNLNVTPGAMLLSQNLLGTSSVQAGYSWNTNEQAGKYLLTWSYTGLYPAFDLTADYGTRRMTYNHGLPSEHVVSWHEFNLSLSAKLPLKWTHNHWYRGVRPQIGGTYKHIDEDFYYDEGKPVDRNFFTVDYSVFLYNQEKISQRDLYPRWGQLAELTFRNTPFNSAPHSQFSAEGWFYFPGILKHHSFSIYAGYQEKNEVYYSFSDQIRFPRGYTGLNGDHLLSLSATYSLPLFYPEWSLGPVLYFKRFRTALFYDHAYFFNTPGTGQINSTGIDLLAEIHLLGFFVPVETGLRTIYQPETGQVQFRFLFNINIAGL